MKNVCLTLTFLFFSTFALFSQNEADKTAIQQVITNETNQWAAKNYDGWAKNWLQTPEVGGAFNNADGSFTAVTGWDVLSKMMKESFQQDPKPMEVTVTRENFVFRFYGNGAYVTFDQYPGKKGEVKLGKEFRIMEKTKDGWKLVSVIALWDYSK